ncbi:hypothetical protein F5148DRAFT_1369306 [Russula earlei]|uniref:Uncharacterized protein n=1 Tax=Russula earlei TaxID=71964 RepID=A0ACC0U2T3_9AGAM|nr:hypothetical protein F5148DRAFT_1369306 [Russula earlei]
MDDGVLPPDSDSDNCDGFNQEQGWEEPATPDPSRSPSPEGEVFNNNEDIPSVEERWTVEARFLMKPTVLTFCNVFPQSTAGAPIPTASKMPGYAGYKDQFVDGEANIWAPFASKLDWEMARWAKLCGPGSMALTELLKLEGLLDLLGLSYKNVTELNKIIDKQLPSRPRFQQKEIVIAGDPQFTGILVFTPEQHYADPDMGVRLYHDMHTRKWWWEMRKIVEQKTPGATVIPIILSSDKTLVTLFGNKTAYPIYMTIGTLPKEIHRKPSRHGQILLGYLPTTRLQQITNNASHRHAAANLFHACLSRIVRPLKEAGVSGIYMASGDGIVRRCHPIFANYVGDYPEQLLVTLVKNGIKPVYCPFWEDLPYANVYRAITPDILHELYQGVIKHMVSWIIQAYGAAEIDARCRRLPPNHNIHLFFKGISTLSRVTGREHDQMCRFILGIIIDIPLPNNLAPGRLICAVHALLDFLYISQYPIHSTETISILDESLQTFHDNKSIFIDLGIRSDYNFPKLHKAKHYKLAIEAFGTTDNYNTEYTERLHIDLAKDAYRSTNHKDKFSQMTIWLERREKIFFHNRFIQWQIAGKPPPADTSWHAPQFAHRPHIQMTIHPSVQAVPLTSIMSKYGATFFKPALACYVAHMNNPSLTTAVQVERIAQDIDLPFNTIPVYHNIKFWNTDAQGHEETSDLLDSVHIKPSHSDNRGKGVPARFDTVLVKDGDGGHAGVSGAICQPISAIALLKFTLSLHYQTVQSLHFLQPRLWLGPRRLWLSKTPGRAKAVKPGLAPAWPGLGHGFYYDNGSIQSPSTSLALPLNAFIPSVFKSEHGSSPHVDLRHDTIAVRLHIAPSQDRPSSIFLASATHLHTHPYDAFVIITIALPKGSLPTAPRPSSLLHYSRARCP